MAQKPAVALMLCLSAVGLAAQASASPASSNTHLTRRLLAQSAADSAPAQRQLLQQSLEAARPQCVWKDGKCDALLPENWLVYTGVPTSPYMRARLVAHTRNEHCMTTHKNKAACWKDTSNRCLWMEHDGRQVCLSIDWAQVNYYRSHNFIPDMATIPLAMTCPGSKAAEFFSCFVNPGLAGSCGYLSQCYSINADGATVCFPNWMRSYDQRQYGQLLDKLRGFDAALYGKCAGVCWMKQAKECLTKTNKNGCDTLPYCRWSSGTCSRSALLPAEVVTEYDRKVMGLYSACGNAATPEACLAFTDPRLTARRTAIDWKSYVAPAPDVACSV